MFENEHWGFTPSYEVIFDCDTRHVNSNCCRLYAAVLWTKTGNTTFTCLKHQIISIVYHVIPLKMFSDLCTSWTAMWGWRKSLQDRRVNGNLRSRGPQDGGRACTTFFPLSLFLYFSFFFSIFSLYFSFYLSLSLSLSLTLTLSLSLARHFVHSSGLRLFFGVRYILAGTVSEKGLHFDAFRIFACRLWGYE